MLVRKPLFRLEGDDEPGGGTAPEDAPKDAPEAPAGEPEKGDEESESPEDSAEPGEEPFDKARALAKIKKANAEAKTQRDRAKAAEDKAKGLEPAARDAALQRVARRLSLPDTEEVDEFLNRLKGDTVEELAEDAERLLTLLAPKETKSTERKATERLRGGGDPDTEPAVDNSKLAESILTGF